MIKDLHTIVGLNHLDSPETREDLVKFFNVDQTAYIHQAERTKGLRLLDHLKSMNLDYTIIYPE